MLSLIHCCLTYRFHSTIAATSRYLFVERETLESVDACARVDVSIMLQARTRQYHATGNTSVPANHLQSHSLAKYISCHDWLLPFRVVYDWPFPVFLCLLRLRL